MVTLKTVVGRTRTIVGFSTFPTFPVLDRLTQVCFHSEEGIVLKHSGDHAHRARREENTEAEKEMENGKWERRDCIIKINCIHKYSVVGLWPASAKSSGLWYGKRAVSLGEENYSCPYTKKRRNAYKNPPVPQIAHLVVMVTWKFRTELLDDTGWGDR